MPVMESDKEPVEKVTKPKRTRKKSSDTDASKDDVTENVVPEQPKKEVIPILSVLSDESEENIDTKSTDDTVINDEQHDENPDVMIIADTTDIVSVQQDAEPSNPILDTLMESDAEPEFVTEPENNFDSADIQDDTPVVETETATIQYDDDDNQLEKLLQSVQSLHEDKEPEPELKIVESDFDIAIILERLF